MRESRRLEFKEQFSNTFLKTVSAYANYGTGEVLFGVSDDGRTVGLENPERDRLRGLRTPSTMGYPHVRTSRSPRTLERRS